MNSAGKLSWEAKLDKLFAAYQRGTRELAAVLFEEFAGHFRQLIRKQLARAVLREDVEDVLQGFLVHILGVSFEEKYFVSAIPLLTFCNKVCWSRVRKTNRHFLLTGKEDLGRQVDFVFAVA